MTSQITGQPAELRATITIKRTATGQTETFELVGRAIAESPLQTPTEKDLDHGRHPFDRGA